MPPGIRGTFMEPEGLGREWGRATLHFSPVPPRRDTLDQTVHVALAKTYLDVLISFGSGMSASEGERDETVANRLKHADDATKVKATA